MKKRIIAVAAAALMMASAVTPAFASYSSAGATESKLNASERMAAAGTLMAAAKTIQSDDVDAASGVTFNRVSQLTDSQKANLNTALQEILKKVPETRIKAMYTGDIDATGSGKITFKALGSYSGAIVMHQASNGVWDNTAEECKNGEVEHTFNGFSPVAILVSDMTKNQLKATDFATSIGNAGSSNGSSTSGNAAAGNAAAGNAAAAAGANGASPKTGEAGTLYVLLAMAAVAGTAVVATKKSR
jgi:LPXTG-motif cell wall-anchored protein